MAESVLSSPPRSRTDFNVSEEDQENVSSSSPLRPSSLKQRKPPTVTPKRFTKFFTPRCSLSGRHSRQSKAGRQLRDITRNSVNRKTTDTANHELQDDGLISSRPTKRRKHTLDATSSPLHSSPIKQVHWSPSKQIQIFEDDTECTHLTDDDFEPVDAPKHLSHPPPIRRLRQTGTAHRLLSRSFGGHESLSRGRRGPEHCGPRLSSTANFCSVPRDVHSSRSHRGVGGGALPFCTAPCNTNTLIAIGDEEGHVRLLDTAPSAEFQLPHVTFLVHHNAIMDLAFSPCDYILATASGDQTARIVDMQTQRTLCVLAGHRSSVKQVRFHPGNDKLLTTSARDGLVNVWDLRCSKSSVQSLRIGYQPADNDFYPAPQNLYPYATMSAGPAHRVANAKDRIIKSDMVESLDVPAGVSITSIEHLPGSHGHLLLSASEQNASLKLFDLRTAGRNSKSERMGFEVPVSCTSVPEAHMRTRNYGISALALSGDGARAYSVCRDNTIYAYSTNHLILGSASEMVDVAKRTRMTPPEKPKGGLGPLYAFRNPALRSGSFYIKAAVRKAGDDKDELLAVGSQEGCAVLFPTDERNLNLRPETERPTVAADEDDDDSLPCSPPPPSKRDAAVRPSGFAVIDKVGTPLVRGHHREVTSLAFVHGGELVTISDDFTARCWREDAERARSFRTCGEGGGKRWACGWADVVKEWDDDDDA